MTRAVLALGSNLGDRLDLLQRALNEVLRPEGVVGGAVSPVYETAPIGGPDQPDYLNAVALVDTSWPPIDLLRHCQEVENAMGRVRQERWGARTLDIDIVCYGDVQSTDPILILPHPRAHERAFVLLPWYDVEATAQLPGYGSVATLLAGIDRSGVRSTRLGLRLPVV